MSKPPFLLFPAAPLGSSLVDSEFVLEVKAAQAAGFEVVLYRLGALRRGEVEDAIVGAVPTGSGVHRGWMLNDVAYAALHGEMGRRGGELLVSPDAYSEAHYLPFAYPLMIGETPESIWMPGADADDAWNLYQTMAKYDVILKDYVKSAKYRWREACFIPAGTSRDRFDDTIRAFLEVRGSLFEKGLVFRKFHPLIQTGEDMRGMPIHEEYRLFYWRGELLLPASIPENRGQTEWLPRWTAIARRFRTPLLAMDVARQVDGSYTVVEVGDGGVAGLPVYVDPHLFYSRLWQAMTDEAKG